MFIGVKRASIVRAPILYLLFGWIPAVMIATAAALTSVYARAGLFHVILFAGLNAGIIAPAIVAFSAAARHRHFGGETPACLPNVLGVLGAAVVSGMPLFVGAVGYLMCVAGRPNPEGILVAFFSLPAMVLVGGSLGLPGHYVGVMAARAMVPARYYGGRRLAIWGVASVATGTVLGVNLLPDYIVSTRFGLSRLLIGGLFLIFLLGILWACVGALAYMCSAASPGWRRLLLFAAAVVLAASAAVAMYAFGGGRLPLGGL